MRALKILVVGVLVFVTYIVFSGSISPYDLISGLVVALIVGYRRWIYPNTPSRPPVLINYTNVDQEGLIRFVNTAVDPLPQALVLTAIVISLAVTLFLVFLALQIYRVYGTLDVREIKRLKG